MYISVAETLHMIIIIYNSDDHFFFNIRGDR